MRKRLWLLLLPVQAFVTTPQRRPRLPALQDSDDIINLALQVERAADPDEFRKLLDVYRRAKQRSSSNATHTASFNNTTEDYAIADAILQKGLAQQNEKSTKKDSGGDWWNNVVNMIQGKPTAKAANGTSEEDNEVVQKVQNVTIVEPKNGKDLSAMQQQQNQTNGVHEVSNGKSLPDEPASHNGKPLNGKTVIAEEPIQQHKGKPNGRMIPPRPIAVQIAESDTVLRTRLPDNKPFLAKKELEKPQKNDPKPHNETSASTVPDPPKGFGVPPGNKKRAAVVTQPIGGKMNVPPVKPTPPKSSKPKIVLNDMKQPVSGVEETPTFQSGYQKVAVEPNNHKKKVFPKKTLNDEAPQFRSGYKPEPSIASSSYRPKSKYQRPKSFFHDTPKAKVPAPSPSIPESLLPTRITVQLPQNQTVRAGQPRPVSTGLSNGTVVSNVGNEPSVADVPTNQTEATSVPNETPTVPNEPATKSPPQAMRTSDGKKKLQVDDLDPKPHVNLQADDLDPQAHINLRVDHVGPRGLSAPPPAASDPKSQQMIEQKTKLSRSKAEELPSLSDPKPVFVPLAERNVTIPPAEELYEMRNQMVTETSKAGSSRWGTAELDRFSANVSVGYLADQTSDLYIQRNIKVARAAKKRKSRWMAAEVDRFAANVPVGYLHVPLEPVASDIVDSRSSARYNERSYTVLNSFGFQGRWGNGELERTRNGVGSLDDLMSVYCDVGPVPETVYVQGSFPPLDDTVLAEAYPEESQFLTPMEDEVAAIEEKLETDLVRDGDHVVEEQATYTLPLDDTNDSKYGEWSTLGGRQSASVEEEKVQSDSSVRGVDVPAYDWSSLAGEWSAMNSERSSSRGPPPLVAPAPSVDPPAPVVQSRGPEPDQASTVSRGLPSPQAGVPDLKSLFTSAWSAMHAVRPGQNDRDSGVDTQDRVEGQATTNVDDWQTLSKAWSDRNSEHDETASSQHATLRLSAGNHDDSNSAEQPSVPESYIDAVLEAEEVDLSGTAQPDSPETGFEFDGPSDTSDEAWNVLSREWSSRNSETVKPTVPTTGPPSVDQGVLAEAKAVSDWSSLASAWTSINSEKASATTAPMIPQAMVPIEEFPPAGPSWEQLSLEWNNLNAEKLSAYTSQRFDDTLPPEVWSGDGTPSVEEHLSSTTESSDHAEPPPSWNAIVDQWSASDTGVDATYPDEPEALMQESMNVLHHDPDAAHLEGDIATTDYGVDDWSDSALTMSDAVVEDVSSDTKEGKTFDWSGLASAWSSTNRDSGEEPIIRNGFHLDAPPIAPANGGSIQDGVMEEEAVVQGSISPESTNSGSSPVDWSKLSQEWSSRNTETNTFVDRATFGASGVNVSPERAPSIPDTNSGDDWETLAKSWSSRNSDAQ